MRSFVNKSNLELFIFDLCLLALVVAILVFGFANRLESVALQIYSHRTFRDLLHSDW